MELPVKPAIEIAGTQVPTYLLMLTLGASLFIWVSVRSARRQGLGAEWLPLLPMATYLSALVGARLFFALERVLDAPAETELSVAALFGGYVSHGAFVLGLATVVAGAAFMRLPFLALADAFSPGLCLLGALGRLGCFLAGCCHGRPTEAYLGVVFPSDSAVALRFGPGVPVHATQLYEMGAWMFALLAVSLASRRGAGPGSAFLGLILSYSVARFGLEFTRGDHQIVYWSLHLAQWYSLAAVFLVVLAASRFSHRPALSRT